MHNSFKKIPLPIIVSITGSILAVLLLLFFYLYERHSTEAAPAPTPAAVAPKPQIAVSPLEAKSAIVYDPATGQILYSKNADVTMPLASLTKLMTAETVLNTVPTSTLITLSKKDVSVDGDAGDWNLKAGDTMTLGNILKLGMDASSNHAMSAAAAALGAGYINELNKNAQQMDLSHTYFLNATGLDLNTDTSGGYGSASDIARLAAAFMRNHPMYFELGTHESVTVPVTAEGVSREVTANATALPILDIPGIIGVKTGYTDLAGGNLVVAFDEEINHPLIAVVLGSSENGRFTDMRTLITAARTAKE